MQPDRLSELFPEKSIQQIAHELGRNETIIFKQIAIKEGIKITVSRQQNITFWQAFAAITWFPVLATAIAIVLWSKDQNSVVVRYATDHLAITATGIFAAWIVASALMIGLFRYIRNS